MSIQRAIVEHLLAVEDVAAVVSTRIFRDVAIMGTLPYCTVTLPTAGDHVHGQGGAQGLVHRRVQVDVFTASTSDRGTLIEEIRLATVGFSGDMGDEPVTVRNIKYEGDRQSVIPPKSADDGYTYRVTIELMVWHEEAVPV
ncbi:MAG TPA: hypothetical protein ENI79_02305 [Rhodospirillales bacterium]|nr:hypothetical protein [Rhodospirillales bacterium]